MENASAGNNAKVGVGNNAQLGLGNNAQESSAQVPSKTLQTLKKIKEKTSQRSHPQSPLFPLRREEATEDFHRPRFQQ